MHPEPTPHPIPATPYASPDTKSLEALIEGLLGVKYEALVIDNGTATVKSMDRDQYSFRIDKDSMRLEIKKDVAKHVIECNVKTKVLRVNGQEVERSLYDRFAQKVDLVLRDVNKGHARLEFKKLKGELS